MNASNRTCVGQNDKRTGVRGAIAGGPVHAAHSDGSSGSSVSLAETGVVMLLLHVGEHLTHTRVPDGNV